METPIAILAGQGVPTGSFVQAALHINASNENESDYRAKLVQILGTDLPEFESQIHAKMAYAYFTQNFLKRQADGILDVEELYNESVRESEEKMKAAPWLFYTPETGSAQPQIDENGNVKQKKGWKRDKAEELYQKSEDKSRAHMIKVFMEQIDMSQAGASTYYANCKKKFGG
jgi:hypothetical protein